MALQPRLDLRHAQALVMTPQMQQAVKLLQLSNIELNTWVEQELENNPLLERADADRDGRLSEYDTTLPDPISRHDEDTLLDAREGTVEIPVDIDINNQFDDPSYEDAPRDLHL